MLNLLPDLIVPMDRRYTQRFFRWQNPQFQYGQQKCFTEAFTVFAHIARIVPVASYGDGSNWRTSRSKVIDNAVVAVVRQDGPTS